MFVLTHLLLYLFFTNRFFVAYELHVQIIDLQLSQTIANYYNYYSTSVFLLQ